ncbi:MAG TPA: alginate lyase family protein [Campylobacterales bacterium]|nr:alginate lyase family protein [Campylobacterales bacterium]
MLSRKILLFNTVKFLKPIQIWYRLYYFARKKIRDTIGKKPLFSKESTIKLLNLIESIHIIDCYKGQNRFIFLNLDKKFEGKIDWNYSEYGKLWTYNLTYFDYLSQDNQEDNLSLMNSFVDDISTIKDGLEPFPISLRGINWIKYLSYNSIRDKNIENSLYAQYYILLDNLEYHLLGNHLLENGFSLLFGAYYFEDEVLYQKSKNILFEQLDEQILDDGAHFELSPMYHQIMLFRLLDCINLVGNNSWKDKELLEFLRTKAELMLGWLENISYSNGEIPLLNDSANSIAPTTHQLFDYAKRLNLQVKTIELNDSGYRKVSNNRYECVVDIGCIGAEYIPGHAHADTFSFEFRVDGKPFIVDTGLSTYETCDRRTVERSTCSHNTVEINGQNQSEVWGGFRVANRAKVINIKESNDSIEAIHNGYNSILHTRRWSFREDRVIIEDILNKSSNAVARFHFHPDVNEDDIVRSFDLEQYDFKISSYMFSPEFNRQIDAKVLEIKFKRNLKVEIMV